MNPQRILHLLTRPEDPLAREVIHHQQSNPELTLQIIDLTAADPDYSALVTAVFDSDSVQVW